MKTNRLNWIVIVSALVFLISTPAWADGKRPHPYKGKGSYSAQKHYNGAGHEKPSVQPPKERHSHHRHLDRPHARHRHCPGHSKGHPAQGRQHHPPHPRHHLRPLKSGGYLISAAIAEPGVVLSFSVGDHW